MKIYVVLMRRYGDKEKHSYIIGAYTNEMVAIEQGRLENIWRGNKYEPDIKIIELDKLHRKERFEDIINIHLKENLNGK